MRTRVTAAALSGLLALALAGCTTPEPEPTPTSAFSSEDEAFAAAEETYRAYVDALNQVDLSDPETFEAVYSWTTGEANAEARKTFAQMHADGWTVSGISVVNLVEPSSGSDAESNAIGLAICLDVADVTLVDAEGSSMVSADRPDLQSMLIRLEPSTATSTGMAINQFSGRDGEPRCE
ncbi:hypothetical protein JNB63_11265 [Microbacterium trichothecenolyticum]|uniref:hypothetical protein n=1 Tax=Microbacterium trichothecenolyticum TaxID=69370 RepID=UPI001C6F3BD6|nr:hypothetical protein [Microbacterium trichothecenolyticum]MBW9120676.1 hypothetical protein [Microbacterium trichothecenolyticum]